MRNKYIKVIPILSAFLLFLGTASFAGQASSGNVSNEVAKSFWFLDAPKEWPAQVMPGLRGGTEKLKSYIDNLIPILGSKDIILFADEKTVMGTRGSNEENIGAGLRGLLFDEKLIAGANFFYDTRYTENHVRHNQLAFGLEGLTKWVDLRSNFYFPISGKQLLTNDTYYTFGTKSLEQFDTYEEPLTGMDYEAGILIPYLSEYIETRAFIGGYNYFPSYGRGLNGIKARFEMRPIKAFTIDVELKKDNYGPTECFVEGFVTIPLDTMNVFKITNPFSEFSKYFFYKKGIRPLRERMVDRVVRDIDVTAKNTPVLQSKAHDLTYVDNSYTGTSDGSLEHPYTTIQNGVNNATGDKWVYVKQGSGIYGENVTLSNNIVLWGSGYNGGFNGIPTGSYPILGGVDVAHKLAGNIITLANNNTVMGIQAQYAGTDGIVFTTGTTSTGTIKHNVLNNNGDDGIDLSSNTGTISGFTIDGNTINNNTTCGINLGQNSGTMRNVMISNNTVNGNGNEGITMWQNKATGTLAGFVIFNNTCNSTTVNNGIDMGNNSGVMTDFTISYNRTNNNAKNGIDLGDPSYHNTGTMSGFTLSHNTATGNQRYGIVLVNDNVMTGINLGNGAAGGYNSVYGNTLYDVYNISGINSLPAKYNWWGTASPSSSQFGGTNSVDYTNPLSSNPN